MGSHKCAGEGAVVTCACCDKTASPTISDGGCPRLDRPNYCSVDPWCPPIGSSKKTACCAPPSDKPSTRRGSAVDLLLASSRVEWTRGQPWSGHGSPGPPGALYACREAKHLMRTAVPSGHDDFDDDNAPGHDGDDVATKPLTTPLLYRP
jgi:hypothetical protein